MSSAATPSSSPSSSCAEKLRVLADPTRLAIVEALFEAPSHVGELGRRLDVEQSLLSHHLKVLREAGLVVGERDGKAVLYRLATPPSRSTSRKIPLGCCEISFPASPSSGTARR